MNDELRRFVDLIDSHQSSEAEAWARARAESGDADAQFVMGYLVFGDGEVDFREACDWFQRAAAQNHADALFQLSRIDQSENRANWGPPRTEQMRTYLRRAAELGSVDAWNWLGGFLADGRGGFPKDEREAQSWYEKAARAGDVDAQAGLSWMLMRRMSDPASVQEGLRWLEKAASHDTSPRLMERFRSSEALSRLVEIYRRGMFGVPADPEKAASFARRLDEYQARGRASWEALVEAHPELREPVGAVSRTEAEPARRAFGYENPTEAREVLRAHMSTYRRQTHRDLAGLVNKRLAVRLQGPGGARYDVTIEVRWDDQPLDDVFVCGTINDEGWRASQETYEIFSKAPDGTIVGDSG